MTPGAPPDDVPDEDSGRHRQREQRGLTIERAGDPEDAQAEDHSDEEEHRQRRPHHLGHAALVEQRDRRRAARAAPPMEVAVPLAPATKPAVVRVAAFRGTSTVWTVRATARSTITASTTPICSSVNEATSQAPTK